MNVPLTLEAHGEKVYITRNSQKIALPLPFKPYIMAERESRNLVSTPVRKTRIPDGVESVMYKVESDTVELMEEKLKQLVAEGEPCHRLPYQEQIYSELPDLVKEYPNTDPLKIVYLDIEVLTKGDGIFPRPEKAPIIAIGCALNDGEPVIFDNLQQTAPYDGVILGDFVRWYRQADPDIVVTYNGQDFDLPYILARMERADMDTSVLHRWGMSKVRYEDDATIRLRGRVHFDCYPPAKKDQSLFGIKSRSLKEVAKWYDFSVVEIGGDVANTKKLLGTKLLRDYLTSDVKATRAVAGVYLPNAIALAEIVGVPLSAIAGAQPSFIPKLICARNCFRLNLQPLDDNKARYGDTEDGRQDGGRLYNLGSRFEGAVVDIKKFGYFPKVFKVDFASQYPSAIITYNLGPDTTRITAVRDYSGQYSFKREKDRFVVSIPDDNFKKDIEVTIDMSKTGFLKEEFIRLSEERKRLKELMKSTTDKAEETGYDSRQTAIKIIMNSVYGYISSKFATYGDMGIGLTVTGICRWITRYALEQLSNSVVEVDTDGVIVDREPDADKLTRDVAKIIECVHGCPSFFKLEKEELRDAYFHKMKNYIIRRVKKGKLVTEKHGAAFKSSKLPSICDKAIDTICQKVMDRELDDQYLVATRLKNFSKCKLDDFKQRVTFSRALGEYDDKVSVQRVLGLQIEDRLKQKVEEGMQVEYYVTKKPPDCKPVLELYKKAERTKGPYYSIAQFVDSVKQLDREYYENQIDGILEIFSWRTSPQEELPI